MWTPQSVRPDRPSCWSICAFDSVCSAFTVTPVLTSVDTRRCTPELITTPTLGIVIPDLATLVHTIHDRANLYSRCDFHSLCISGGAHHVSKDSASKSLGFHAKGYWLDAARTEGP